MSELSILNLIGKESELFVQDVNFYKHELKNTVSSPVNDTVDRQWQHLSSFEHSCYPHCSVPSITQQAVKFLLVMQNEDDFKLLRLIERNPEISQREIASKSGLSLGKVNYCLKSLAEKGWVKMKRFSRSEHKVGYIYIMTPEGLKTKSSMTIDFLGRKLAEYEGTAG